MQIRKKIYLVYKGFDDVLMEWKSESTSSWMGHYWDTFGTLSVNYKDTAFYGTFNGLHISHSILCESTGDI